jgi:lysozyme family protein
VSKWTNHPAIEFFLRDCAFNRGPTGAARILQTALRVSVDGEVGPQTLKALRNAEADPGKLLSDMREARENYELRVAGRREQFWAGLVNRWNNARNYASSIA